MPPESGASGPTRSSYHHGDLRRALIDAAVAILNDTQRWDFSLREVARRAGVSHNAPYAHFTDKRALLAAVAANGFYALRDRMRAASEPAQSPADALHATGDAYIRFGIENPAFYRLMFGPDLRTKDGLPASVQEAADAGRSLLYDVLHRGAQDGSFDLDENDPATIVAAALARLSLVHGFTMLAIDGLAGLEQPVDVGARARSLTDQFLRGLAT